MGNTLVPRNKSVPQKRVGAFFWSWLLDAGMGHIIGFQRCGPLVQHDFRFRDDPEHPRADPSNGGGYRVTAGEARAMAMWAHGFHSYLKQVGADWKSCQDDWRRKSFKESSGYRQAVDVREDYVTQVEEFAQFAWESRGFRIR